MNTLRCCVVDDEPLAADLISSYIKKTPSLTFAGSYNLAQDAVPHLLNDEVDVVFMDINIPQINGIEFAKILPPHIGIIFATAYDSYALESFHVNVIDYLLKPISYEDFLSSVKKAQMRLNPGAANAAPQHRDYIIVKSEYKLVQIPVDDILYIEGVKDYVKIVVEGDNKSIMTLMNIKSLEVVLPPDRFMRVHRSYIVNTSKINVIERNRIVFGKTYIPISDSYKQTFTNYINERLIQSPRYTE